MFMRDFYYFFLKFILVFPFENLTNFFMMDMHLRLYDAPRWKRITKDFMQGFPWGQETILYWNLTFISVNLHKLKHRLCLSMQPPLCLEPATTATKTCVFPCIKLRTRGSSVNYNFLWLHSLTSLEWVRKC